MGETVTSQACTTVAEPVCATRTVTSYKTETKDECSTTSVQKCDSITRDVPEQKCETHTEEECHEINNQVPETQCIPVTEQVCNDVPECTTEQQCTETQQCVTEQQCTETQQCVTEQQCTTETREIPETTFVDDCQDIVHQVCSETQVHVASHANVISHPAVVGPIAPVAAVNTLPAAGLIAQGPLSAALGFNGLPAGVVPAGSHLLPQRIFKREADAEADADADAEADAQFFGLNPFPVGNLAAGLPLAPAPLLAAGPVALAPAPIAPRCEQKVDRQCRKVPVQTVRHIAVPKCISVPKCVSVPHCVAVPKCTPVPHCVTVPKCIAVPKCVAVERQQCETIINNVPSQVCNPKPVTSCNTFIRQVADTVCHAEPLTKCLPVAFKVAVQTPVEECTSVAREICKPVYKKIPRQHCSVHKAVAVHAHSYGNTAPVLSPVAVLTKSHSQHGTKSGTSYAYGVGKSFSRRDY